MENKIEIEKQNIIELWNEYFFEGDFDLPSKMLDKIKNHINIKIFDINQKFNGRTLLAIGIYNNNFEFVKYLLENGADINLESVPVIGRSHENEADLCPKNIILLASYHPCDNISILELLIKYKININYTTAWCLPAG